jgi:BRCA1-associated protein
MASNYIQYVMDGAQGEDLTRVIELVDEINIEEVLEHPENYRTLRFNAGVSRNHELCLINAPPGMIPTELIQFFGSSLGHISAIRILRHAESVNDADYFAVLRMKDAESCALVHREYHGHVLGSVENSYCVLLPIERTVDQTLSLKVGQNFDGNDLEGQSSCPVCLDVFDEVHAMSFTTCCNHRFHMNCLLRLEGALCPVCR